MADSATSPLLGPDAESSSQRPASKRSTPSIRSNRSKISYHSSESTPLLSRQDDDPNYNTDGHNGEVSSQAELSLQSLRDSLKSQGKGRIRWPTVLALSILCLLCIAILILGFATPAAVEGYAQEAMVFEPTNLAIDSFTSTGVRARVQGNFVLDSSRVHKKSVRDIGKIATWVAKEVESRESEVKVYLPEYGNVLVGTAIVPPVKVNIRDGHINHIDFLSDLQPGDFDGLRQIANDWIEGRIGHLRVQGVADVSLKSGIFSLGTQSISNAITFAGDNLPSMPKFDITKLVFHEAHFPSGDKGMAADASISLFNKYPVNFTVPPLGFDVLVPNCTPEDAYLLLADATTAEIHVLPKEYVEVNVSGIVRQLRDDLTNACPDSESSPLDLLLSRYISGDDTTVYVRGANAPSADAPKWISDLISGVTVPVPFPGHTFDHLIKNFSLANVHFSLPDPSAEPDTPEAQPKVSAVVKALVGLPKEINVPLDVDRVRANADVYYHNKKLGKLDLHKWQSANTSRVGGEGDELSGLLVQSVVDNAPMEITDDDVFSEVIQALIWGSKGVTLGIKAAVDVETVSALGKVVVRKIPAEGKIFVKPISRGGGIGKFSPKVSSLEILSTTKSTLTLKAVLNFTNPTSYSATVPFISINILNNNTVLGRAMAENVSVVPGNNTNITVTAIWEPLAVSGKKGVQVGRELLSQYLSGYNTTLIFRTYEGTIPSQPALGKALSDLELAIPAPKLRTPKNGDGDGDNDGNDNDDDGRPHFIKAATVLSALLETTSL